MKANAFKFPELLLLLFSAYYLMVWPFFVVNGWMSDGTMTGWILFVSWAVHVLLRTFDLLPSIWRWVQVSATILILVVKNWPSQVPWQMSTSVIPGWHLSYPYTDTALREGAIFNLIQRTFWVATVVLFARIKN
jgi:hypothetical protein